jgi:Prokaryotic E2 family E
MSLPQNDLAHLAERAVDYSITTEANMTCVVLRGYVLPAGYDRSQSDLLLRLSPGYPDVPPDMWWFDPQVRLADGRTVKATEGVEYHLGRSWQRWSRHFNAGQWRSGVDCLESFLALIRRELERCVTEAAR